MSKDKQDKPIRTDLAYGPKAGDPRRTPGDQSRSQSDTGSGGHRWAENPEDYAQTDEERDRQRGRDEGSE